MIGFESAFSFGDALFNIPLIKTISHHYGTKAKVATKKQYFDAFDNIPFIGDVIEIDQLGQGIELFQKDPNISHSFQITQYSKFFQYKKLDPEHSLIDTPSWIAQDYGFHISDQRPIFIPTKAEISSTDLFECGPYIAIEIEARSGQSWADQLALQMILDKYRHSHKILWLSNCPPPSEKCVVDLSHYTRRQVIMCMRHAQILFSVGSGFFCASLALPAIYQPPKICCLWIDEVYKYEAKLRQCCWHLDLTWVHNHQELSHAIEQL